MADLLFAQKLRKMDPWSLPPQCVRVLYLLYSYAERGERPSIRGMMADLGYASTNALVYPLDLLESRGLIRRERVLARTIVLTHKLYLDKEFVTKTRAEGNTDE